MGVPGGKAELSGEVSGSEKGVGSPSEHLSTCGALCPPSLPSGLAQVVPGAGGLREQARTEAGGRTARDPSAEGLRSQVQGGGYVSPGVQKGMCASPPAPAPSPLPQGNLETQSWRWGDNFWTGRGTQDPHKPAWSIVTQQAAQEALFQSVSFLFG